jgi:hypothetical protein
MQPKQAKPPKLPDSMKVEQPLSPARSFRSVGHPAVWREDAAGHREAANPCVAGRKAPGWQR